MHQPYLRHSCSKWKPTWLSKSGFRSKYNTNCARSSPNGVYGDSSSVHGAYHTPSIKPASTWALLKPQFLTLVSSFVFPKLCFTEEMLELWQADPVEYLRLELGTNFHVHYSVCLNSDLRLSDENDICQTPVVVATSFLLSLTTNRTKSTFLPIMSFINDVLRSCVPGNPMRPLLGLPF
jgi:hypothetical protein